MDYCTARDELLTEPSFRPSASVVPHRAGHRVLTAAEGRLRASSYPPLRALACEFCSGVLVLRGEVKSFYLRQLAQETVRSLAGIEEIVNLVEVISH